MRWVRVVQALLLLAVIAAGVWLVTWSAEDWADWVVFGVFVLTALGFAIAIHQRQYPTKKRSYRRDPDSNW